MLEFQNSKNYPQVNIVAYENLASADKQVEVLKTFVTKNLIGQEKLISDERSTDSSEFSDIAASDASTNSRSFCEKPEISKYLDDTRAIGILNLSHLLNQFNFFTQNLPRVQPFYAVKCHPDSKIIQVLSDLGCGFDCASQNEIKLVKEILLKNITQAMEKNLTEDTMKVGSANHFSSTEMADRIIFANPCKPDVHLAYAYRNNVKKVTFDSESELEKIAKFLPNASCILRIVCDDVTAAWQFGKKFGANLSQVENLLKTLKRLDLDFAGVSFHVGHGCRTLGIQGTTRAEVI